MEHFGSVVYDSVKAAGGHHMVVLHKGYAIPLHVCNGLFYMDIHLATDDDMEMYPHVFLTADSPWNRDIVDEEFFSDSLQSMSDLPHIQE